MSTKHQEIRQLQDRYDNFHVHKKSNKCLAKAIRNLIMINNITTIVETNTVRRPLPKENGMNKKSVGITKEEGMQKQKYYRSSPFNNIYNSRKILSDRWKSAFVTLLKPHNCSQSNDYLMSLRSYFHKIFVRTIHTLIL